MFVNKFPLHLPRMNEISADEDVVMDDITPVSTPTEQTTSFDNWPPQPPRYGRTASVSSIASSVSNLSQAGGNDFSYSQFASHYKLSENFENVLYETYQTYQTNPQITPFNASNPPAGILNKVSKDALKRAQESGIDIGIEVNNYSLVIIRQKLIQLCRSSSLSSTSSSSNNLQQPPNFAQHQMTTSRANSVSSLNGFPTVNLSSKFSQIPPIQTAHTPMWDIRTPTEQTGSYFSFEVPPTPPSATEMQHANSQQTLQPSFMHEQLELQQHLETQIKQEVVIPELYNATSSRKRESLRLKRNGSKVTYN